jgi:integrase
MARVKDLWLAKVITRDEEGRIVRDEHGRAVTVPRKTGKHPDNGGSRAAKRWLVIWTDPDGKEQAKAFAVRAAAEAHGRKMEADVARDEYIDPKAGTGSFGDLARKFLRLRRVGASSRQRYESILRNHVDPVFGHRPVKAVKPSDIAEWLLHGDISRLGAVMQEAAYFIVAGTFELAVEDKMRKDNPARSRAVARAKAKVETAPRRRWDTGTAWRVIDAVPEEYRVIPVMEAGLGLRQGCAFGISPGDFDLEAGTASVCRQVARVGGRFYFKLPKGGKTRTVPVSRGVASFVEAYSAKFPPAEVTLPWMNEDGTVAPEPVTASLLAVWHGADKRTAGKHIIGSSYDQGVWKPALHRAGLAPAPVKDGRGILRYSSGGRDNGQHALRHLFEMMLGDGGVSMVGQMEFMGHSLARLPVTFRVYGHVTEETFEQARQAVDARLFRLRPVKSPGTVTELKAAQ